MEERIGSVDPGDCLPRAPIDTFIDPFRRFLAIESASGVLLLLVTGLALFCANSSLAEPFLSLWKMRFVVGVGSLRMDYSLQHWVNDGLMALFFFVIGLEVKRELVLGELRDLRSAALPMAAALGGMVAPVALYLGLQAGEPGARGWGIPMATDIAFVVGCLAVLGARVPSGLRVLLLSLAIADDIGAILVIAIGYTESLNFLALALGGLGIGLMVLLLRYGCRNLGVYLLLAALVWLAFHESGVHATIAGVVFGLLTPARPWVSQNRLSRIIRKTGRFLQGEGWEDDEARYGMLREMEVASRKSLSPLERFETSLHPWVGFVIMPLFALANAGVTFKASDFFHPVATAVACGLFLGKPLGVVLFCWMAVRTGLARLPDGVRWPVLVSSALLTGIGFTMALFLASLALPGEMLDAAKVGVLAGSLGSALCGMTLLALLLPRKEQVEK